MSITRDQVLHVARLAKLRLSDAEVDTIGADLAKILDYVALLSDLDTVGVPPTAQVAVESAPLRSDEVAISISTEETLAEAPRRHGDGFAVPGFMDEG
jgi:aspartyl-tRNA(Asn)/glutamyl-tRNA(Gln) amidotransferase subunit C